MQENVQLVMIVAVVNRKCTCRTMRWNCEWVRKGERIDSSGLVLLAKVARTTSGCARISSDWWRAQQQQPRARRYTTHTIIHLVSLRSYSWMRVYLQECLVLNFESRELYTLRSKCPRSFCPSCLSCPSLINIFILKIFIIHPASLGVALTKEQTS